MTRRALCAIAGAALVAVQCLAALQDNMVWTPEVAPGTQAYVAFRKSFSLAAAPGPGDASLHLFADSRYMMWLNGAYVLRGPCRFNPASPEYDSVDVSSLLTAGSNTLVALVHTYGAGAINGRIMAHAPGLTVELVVDNTTAVVTDASWRCSADTEYRPSPIAWSSIPDVIDATASPGNWTSPAFNDSAWAHAVPANGSSWGALLPRFLPLPRETTLAGLAVLPARAPLTSALPLALPAGAAVVIDLGRMVMAYTAIGLSSASAGSIVTVEYALRYINNATSEGYGAGTTYTARAGEQQFVGADQWVSHYMTIKCTAGVVTLLSVATVDRSYPFERLGSFASADDALLTTLWERAVNTIVAVTDDAYGSDARERNEWLQDPAQPNFITTRVALAGPPDAAAGAGAPPAYADARILRNLLRHAALAALPDGRIRATFPTDRGAADCHYFIEDYACQWVEALRLYFDATGDAAFVQGVWPVLTAQMAWFQARVTAPRGLLLAREYTSFDDPLAYITAEGTALNAFYFQALNDAAYLAVNAVNASAAAANYTAAAAALASAVNAALWNATEGSYNSGFLPGAPAALGPTVHGSLLALQRGIVPPDRRAGVYAWFLANYKNAGGFHVCSNPDYAQMVAQKAGVNMPVVYYWVWAVLYAADSDAGDLEAVAEMRRRWGPMVAASNDTGTLWESFGDSESCHNYGAVPAYFLSAYVLGVRLAAPVWRQRHLLIEPRLADLAHAGGVVVTEFGPAEVDWARSDSDSPPPGTGSTLGIRISTPVAATLRLANADGASLVLNGAPVPTTQQGRYAVAELAAGNYTGSAALLAAVRPS